MSEDIQEKLIKSIKEAKSQYYRLILLVSDIGSGKTKVLKGLSDSAGIDIVNVNLLLSKELLELTHRQRILKTPEILNKISITNQAIIILDNLEILFDVNLKLDPLRLLRNISRDRTVVASWNGSINDDKLIYAKLGHPEYRIYDIDDTFIVTMDGMATIDIDKTFNR